MADDYDPVVGAQGRRVGAELEGVPHLDDRAVPGELAEPVAGHQRGVPRSPDADQIHPTLLRQLRSHRLDRVGMLGQHLVHRLRLAHDGVIHQVWVTLSHVLLLCHISTPVSGIVRRPGKFPPP